MLARDDSRSDPPELAAGASEARDRALADVADTEALTERTSRLYCSAETNDQPLAFRWTGGSDRSPVDTHGRESLGPPCRRGCGCARASATYESGGDFGARAGARERPPGTPTGLDDRAFCYEGRLCGLRSPGGTIVTVG